MCLRRTRPSGGHGSTFQTRSRRVEGRHRGGSGDGAGSSSRKAVRRSARAHTEAQILGIARVVADAAAAFGRPESHRTARQPARKAGDDQNLGIVVALGGMVGGGGSLRLGCGAVVAGDGTGHEHRLVRLGGGSCGPEMR